MSDVPGRSRGGTRLRLTKTTVESAPVPASGSSWLWDSEIPGLGVRIIPSGVRTYVLRYSAGRRGATKRVGLGQHGRITLDNARTLARQMWSGIASGRDPALERQRARGVPTLSEFAAEYLDRHAAKHKRAASVRNDRMLLRAHLEPALGSRPLDQITRADVARLHRRMGDTPTTANRVLSLLSHMFTVAERWGAIEPGTDKPTRGVARYAERPRERFLSAEELARLGAALDADETAYAVACIRVQLLTGARPGEIRTLRWEDVDLDAATVRLRRRKRGALRLSLTPQAVAVLRELPRLASNPWVFPGRRIGACLTESGESHVWERVRARAGLEDVRLHDLRHTFASVLASAGVSLPIIGGLLGHTQPATTARYAHLADAPLRQAAEGAAETISAALGTRGRGDAREKRSNAT